MSYSLSQKDELKKRFGNGKKPNQDDFAALIDSCYGYVSKAELNEDLNVLQITVPDDDSGDKVFSVNLAQLSLSLNFNYLKNTMFIGDKSDPKVIGYWKPSDAPEIDIAPMWISTDSKVGIKTDEPEADLHVNGSLKLKTGEKADEIVASLTDAVNSEKALPTVKALEDELQSRAKLIFYGEILFVPSQTIDVTGFPITLGNLHRFDFKTTNYPFNEEYDGRTFEAPTNGIYEFKIGFKVASYNVLAGGGFVKIYTNGGVNEKIFVMKENTSGEEVYVNTTRTIMMAKGHVAQVAAFVHGAMFINSESCKANLSITRILSY